ncbi:hypothetical protein [Hymenobacter sp. B81]
MLTAPDFGLWLRRSAGLLLAGLLALALARASRSEPPESFRGAAASATHG